MIPKRSGRHFLSGIDFELLSRGTWTIFNQDRKSARERETSRGWYDRGYLPHFDGRLTQAVTFRLADSLPPQCVTRWQAELRHCERADGRARLFALIEKHLDAGFGACHLADPRIGSLVRDALLYFHREPCDLRAWVIMPNHVHALFTPLEGVRIERILHSWKSFTSKQANRILGRSGPFWQHETYDRFIRDDAHLASAIHYIEDNPVAAGLCRSKEDWQFSSANEKHRPAGE